MFCNPRSTGRSFRLSYWSNWCNTKPSLMCCRPMSGLPCVRRWIAPLMASLRMGRTSTPYCVGNGADGPILSPPTTLALTLAATHPTRGRCRRVGSRWMRPRDGVSPRWRVRERTKRPDRLAGRRARSPNLRREAWTSSSAGIREPWRPRLAPLHSHQPPGARARGTRHAWCARRMAQSCRRAFCMWNTKRWKAST